MNSLGLRGRLVVSKHTFSHRRRFQEARCRPRIEPLEERCLLSADVVLQWNAVALDAVKNDYALGQTPEQEGPTRASRALAIVQAAIYDAVDAVDRQYTPYLVDVQAKPNTSLVAAAAQAGHDTLTVLFPLQQPLFDKALAASLTRIASGPAQRGIQLGAFVAQKILAARQNDGSANNVSYTPDTDPGDWQPDPLHPTQKALTPGWGQVSPFCMVSGSQFQVPPPPPLGSAAYAAAFDQVKALGGDGITTPTVRTPEETQIGIFWGYDGSPGIGVPPRMYNQIAQVLAVQEGNTVVQNARLFALVNLALADTGIAVWDTKYTYNFWRPITAIRDGALDGNPLTTADPNWTPLGAPADNGSGPNFTPPFPAYTSGHAGFGAALFRTLADFYGMNTIHFTIGSDEFNGITRDQHGLVRPVVTRSFNSFSQAAEENAQSRIYLGIHWIFDKQEGLLQGREVADYVFAHFLLPLGSPGGPTGQPVSGDGSPAANAAGSDVSTLQAQVLVGRLSTDVVPSPASSPRTEESVSHGLGASSMPFAQRMAGDSGSPTSMLPGPATHKVHDLAFSMSEWWEW
jgi:hypothetical protein